MASRRIAAGYLLSLTVAVAVGITLVVLALPRTAAGISELHGSWAIAELRADEPISDHDIDLAINSLVDANGWVNTAPRWTALARLHYARALRADANSAARQDAFRLSQDASHRAISLNPALPEPWLRLAQTEYALNRVSPQMIRALAMAYRTGRFNRFTVFAMSELAFIAWGHLESDTRSLAVEQFAFAVRQRSDRLAAISERLHASAIVRRALRREPEMLAKFERAVKRQKPG
ncbi:MAG: hypothetical protein QF449_00460 [Alphaproteobacteria bacterium]|jgi:hypothetical protein|nr:hypothetical protein [Alphaproteobacteria bacterium]MDP6589161.1 hypothetical protein [Alphaproteobacteria bacterium]MDP6816494.1 hypothetical protein [Alphaproteobacteria bacterium]